MYALAAMCLAELPNYYWKRSAVETLGSFEVLLRANSEQLREWQFPPKLIHEIHTLDYERVKQLASALVAKAISFISIEDADYPAQLRAIADPPLGLFVKGNKDLLNQPQIAMVGSRQATQSALALTKTWARELAQQGIVVTSGMAMGVDAAAHAGALEASGQTIAVLGCGLNYEYPRQNAALMRALLEHGGAMVSEYLPDVVAHAKFFPQRNRIISGLSRGVVIMEAAQRSGTLITARLASEQGRDVFAVPGRLDNPNTAGCHYLIQNGAKLATSVTDILEEYGWCAAVQVEVLPAQQQVIMGLLSSAITPVDELVAKSGLAFAEVCSVLLELECKSLVGKASGGYFKK